MAATNPPSYKYFNLSYPLPFVAHVEINRPEKMNAFIEPMWLEFRDIFTHLSHDPSTRAIVLSGAGPQAFTSGLDVLAASQSGVLAPQSSASSSNTQKDGARIATDVRRHILEFQDCISAVERCEKPVVAALHGYTLGLGIDIAVCCDVRMCAAETRFAVKEVDIGLAADIGTLSRLVKVVGAGSWVKDVCLSGRFFGAKEAGKVGFVSWVAEKAGKEAVLEEAIKWAGMVAGKSPVAVQGTKELLNWSREHNVQDGLRYTSVWNSAMLQSRDVTNAMTAGMQKKPPRFEKL